MICSRCIHIDNFNNECLHTMILFDHISNNKLFNSEESFFRQLIMSCKQRSTLSLASISALSIEVDGNGPNSMRVETKHDDVLIFRYIEIFSLFQFCCYFLVDFSSRHLMRHYCCFWIWKTRESEKTRFG